MTPPELGSTTHHGEVDPATVIIGTNIHADVRVTKAFVEFIREHGVLQPVCLRQDETGALLLDHGGQRRVLAAIEAGRTLPAAVVTGDTDAARRVFEQMAENDDRDALTGIGREAAFQALALTGLPAGEIAKRTGRTKTSVEAGIAAAASKAATEALNTYDLTLEDAVVFATFEDDHVATARLATAVAAALRTGPDLTQS